MGVSQQAQYSRRGCFNATIGSNYLHTHQCPADTKPWNWGITSSSYSQTLLQRIVLKTFGTSLESPFGKPFLFKTVDIGSRSIGCYHSTYVS